MIENLLGQREIVFGLLIILVLSQITSGKTILCITILGLYYAYDYVNINMSLYSLFSYFTKENELPVIFEDNGKKYKIETNVNNGNQSVIKYVKRLRKYRKYNKVSYDNGYKHITRYMYVIEQMRNDIPNARSKYDNAELSYQSAIKEFQSLNVSVPSHRYSDATTKPEHYHKTHRDYSEKVGELCKKLNDICYYQMYEISLRINSDWSQNPSPHKSEIIQVDIRPSNAVSHNHMY